MGAHNFGYGHPGCGHKGLAGIFGPSTPIVRTRRRPESCSPRNVGGGGVGWHAMGKRAGRMPAFPGAGLKAVHREALPVAGVVPTWRGRRCGRGAYPRAREEMPRIPRHTLDNCSPREVAGDCGWSHAAGKKMRAGCPRSQGADLKVSDGTGSRRGRCGGWHGGRRAGVARGAARGTRRTTRQRRDARVQRRVPRAGRVAVRSQACSSRRSHRIERARPENCSPRDVGADRGGSHAPRRTLPTKMLPRTCFAYTLFFRMGLQNGRSLPSHRVGVPKHLGPICRLMNVSRGVDTCEID